MCQKRLSSLVTIEGEQSQAVEFIVARWHLGRPEN